MAASPTIDHGTEFLEESLWYPSDEASPSAQSCRLQTPQPGADNTASQNGCSIAQICPLIENPEKAKVVAAIALNLLVFDGRLHHGRNNWACPFGHCKDTFSNAQNLMRHILGCSHFSSNKVYCNCCNKDHCFADQSHDDGFCGGEEDETGPCHEKSPPRKAKTIRKLTTNLTDFFTRSRPGSRNSSQGLEHPVSPASTTVRQQSVFSVVTPTPRPSSAPRKQPIISSPEPLDQQAGSPVDQCHEMDAVSSMLCEVPGSGVIRAQELPASEHGSGVFPNSRRSDSGFSEPSSLSMAGATVPMFTDMGDMTESPTEDLSMDARIPSWDVLQEANAAASRQIPHETETSHFSFPSASANRPVSQYRSAQGRQSSWTFMQQSHPQSSVQLSSRCAYSGVYVANGIPISDQASFAMLNQNSDFQPVVSPLSWEPTTSPYRQGSGDSGFSNGSHTMVGSGGPDSSPRPDHSRQSGSCGAALGAIAVRTSPDFCSPPAETDSIYCPYCNYRPKGKSAGRRANLNKHIKNQHESNKIPCPGCDKEFSRKDNLATHQTNTCKRRLFGVEFRSRRRYAEMETGGDWVDGRSLHTAKRVRQDMGVVR